MVRADVESHRSPEDAVVPRYPDTPREYWGVRLSQWPDAPRGGIDAITAICNRLRRALSTI
jgi:hypothetical protein